MLNAQDILRLLKQGEGQTVEFKVNTPHPEHLSRLLSSLANTSGGTVLVGVQEPEDVKGTEIGRFDKIVRLAQKRLHGQIDVTHYPVVVNGKSIGVIEVRKAKIPVAASGGYFHRVGDREMPLESAQLVQRMAEVPDHVAAIESLTVTIADLRTSFEKANSWKLKAFYAVLGAVATTVVKLTLASLGFVIG